MIATPEMQDSNFARAVIYLCEFSREGAMGLIINRPAPRLNFSEILRQLGIDSDENAPPIRVQMGGPVGSGHGFVLHSDDYFKESTLRLPDGVALTGTMDILRAISSGDGPRKSFLALGYAGWGAGQLDAELAQNAWLTADCDEELLFNAALETVGVAHFRGLAYGREDFPRFRVLLASLIGVRKSALELALVN